jgi:hypothetical protein
MITYLEWNDSVKYLHITNSLSHHIGQPVQVNKILLLTGNKTKEAWSVRLCRRESSDLATDSRHKTRFVRRRFGYENLRMLLSGFNEMAAISC